MLRGDADSAAGSRRSRPGSRHHRLVPALRRSRVMLRSVLRVPGAGSRHRKAEIFAGGRRECGLIEAGWGRFGTLRNRDQDRPAWDSLRAREKAVARLQPRDFWVRVLTGKGGPGDTSATHCPLSLALARPGSHVGHDAWGYVPIGGHVLSCGSVPGSGSLGPVDRPRARVAALGSRYAVRRRREVCGLCDAVFGAFQPPDGASRYIGLYRNRRLGGKESGFEVDYKPGMSYPDVTSYTNSYTYKQGCCASCTACHF